MSRTPDRETQHDEESRFGQDGRKVVDPDAGKSEEEKLEEAVEDLKSDPE